MEREVTMCNVAEVDPVERFAGVSPAGYFPVHFRRGSRFYCCPRCGRKRRIKAGDLDTWNPAPSPFPESLQQRFGQPSTHTATYDFYCEECGLAVRLAYWEQERGMGGGWFPYLKAVFETDPEP